MTDLITRSEPLLWDCLWQSTLCLLLGCAGSLCFGKRPVRAHRVLLLALGAALLAPLLSVAVRHYHWGMLPPKASGAAMDVNRPNLSGPAFPLAPATAFQQPTGQEKPQGSAVLTNTIPSETAAAVHNAGVNARPRIAWETVAALIWVVLSGLAVLRLSVSILRGLALIHRAVPNADGSIQKAAEMAASKLGIAAAPEVWISKEVGCPVIWCWEKRPLLLIPADALPSRGNLDWEGLFCHELAHWKRRDHLAELIAELGAVFLPWQPLVWWARTRLAHLADAVCDEWALHCGQHGPAYANSLVELLPQLRPVGAIPAVRNRRKLERRIRRILNHKSPQPLAGAAWSRWIGIAMALATGLLTFLQIQTSPRASADDQAAVTEVAQIQTQTSEDVTKPLRTASARRLVTGDSQDFFDYSENLALSPDGRYLARVSYNRELILVDTSTGTQKKVAERCDGGVVWSADGKRIAYGSWPDDVPLAASTATNRVVRVVGIDTGKSEVLWEGDLNIEDWSSENQVLLGFRHWKFGGPNCVLVDLRSGTKTDFAGNPIIRSFPRCLSPNGKFIAYCSADDVPELCIHDIAASNHVVLAGFPGKKSDAIWSPDGKHLAFRCSQPGAGQEHQDLWCVQVRDGKFVGTPFPVMGDVGAMTFYNWARNGQLAYSVTFKQRSGLYALPVNPETAQATGPVRWLVRAKASAFTGVWVHTWSPDSREIAFISDQELYFVSAANGETLRRVSLSRLKKHGGSFGLAWSPDGRTMALPGIDDRGRQGWFGVDVRTGDERLLFEVATNANVWSPHWLPGGKSLVFDGLQPRGIYLIDLEEKVPRRLASKPANQRLSYLLTAVSPDGRSVFYNDRKSHVFSTTIDTEETREFLPNVKAGGLRGGFSWLPNSRHAVFRDQNKIWAVAVPDGEPFEIASLPNELDGYSISPPKCSPDGKVITFAADSDKVEYWVMENFLPPGKVAAK